MARKKNKRKAIQRARRKAEAPKATQRELNRSAALPMMAAAALMLAATKQETGK
jgi:hypothetical protein